MSSTILATRPLAKWRAIDLLTLTFLGVALGVAFWGYNQLYAAVLGGVSFAYPPLAGIWAGPWLIAGVVGGLVIRRPGAALGCEMIAAVVSMLLGNQWGWLTALAGLLQGLGAELAFAIFGYRLFSVAVAVLAGFLSVPFEWAFESWYYYRDWAISHQLARLAFNAISGVLIAGIGGWVLTKALAAAGAIRAMPPGQEAVEARLNAAAVSSAATAASADAVPSVTD